MSPPASLQRHTGFFDGHLKCTAIRHGWTRSFSISQDELEDLDYASLSRILELNTLKLRSTNLRIFVENPQDSGTFTQIHYWKDDGSLQSVLVKEFFMQRLEQDALLRFEIRDGKERSIDVVVDDLASEGSGSGLFRKGSLKGSVFSMNWLSGRRAPRTEGSTHTYVASESEETGLSRIFKFLFGSRSKRAKGYTQQLPGDNDESAPLRPVEPPSGAEVTCPPVTERSALLAAGKKSSLRQRLLYASQNHGPFFSSGGPYRSVGHPTPTKDTAAQYHAALGNSTASTSRTSRGPSSQPTPVEEVSMWEQESTTADEDASGREAPPGLITAFWRSFWTARSTPTQEPATTDQPRPAQKAKRASKPPRRKSTRAAALPPAELHFKGAHVVRRPEDAFPPRPDSAAGTVADRRPAEDDPFRG